MLIRQVKGQSRRREGAAVGVASRTKYKYGKMRVNGNVTFTRFASLDRVNTTARSNAPASTMAIRKGKASGRGSRKDCEKGRKGEWEEERAGEREQLLAAVAAAAKTFSSYFSNFNYFCRL